MTRCLVVLVTAPPRHAKRLAKLLITKRLAACVNIVPAVESVFWWEGKVDRAREVLLLIKTTAARFESLRRAIVRHHPYDVPEILALPILKAHQPYTRWISSSVQ